MQAVLLMVMPRPHSYKLVSETTGRGFPAEPAMRYFTVTLANFRLPTCTTAV
jgi:hypothetical protein